MTPERLTYFTSKKVGKAIWDYQMLKEGDKVLMAVSGGKDSLCLLRIMKERIKFVPIYYEVTACYVYIGFEWVNKYSLVRHLENEGLPYIIAQPPSGWNNKGDYNCFWCSWNRRKSLFNLAHEKGFTKIVFAHHMDDIIETMLLNLFFNGEICTMTPYQELFEGRLAIIRPLAYVEEVELARLASMLSLPVVSSLCPNSMTSKRTLVKNMVRELKKHNKNVKKNIFRSVKRVRHEYLLEHTV